MSGDFTPLYVHIARLLRAQILDGTLTRGERIPSETQLVQRHATTRGTVRAAVDILVNEGLVRREQGRGSFVVYQPVRHSILNFGGVSDSVRGPDEVPLSQVVEASVVTEDGRRFLRLVRLRGIRRDTHEEIASLDTSLIPLDRFPGLDGLDFEGRSLYRTFRQDYGVRPARTVVTLATHVPSPRERELLSEPPDGPALLTAHGSAFDTDDIEIERMRIVYASRIEFSLTTTLPSDGTPPR